MGALGVDQADDRGVAGAEAGQAEVGVGAGDVAVELFEQVSEAGAEEVGGGVVCHSPNVTALL